MVKRRIRSSPSIPDGGRATAAEPKRAGRKKPSAPAAVEPPFVPPYPASGFDRLSSRLERLRISAYLVYGLLGLILFLLLTLIQWREGGYPPGVVRPFHVLLAAWSPFMLALTHYLDRLATDAFDRFRPALAATPAAGRDLQYRLTTLPARPTAFLANGLVLVNSFWMLFDHWVLRPGIRVSVVDLGPQLFQVAPTPLSLTVVVALLLGVWWTTAVFLYHTIHQLRVISRIYTRHTHIRLLHLGPLYAFSRVTQQTTIGIVSFFYIFSLTATGFRAQPALLLLGGILWAAIGAVTFAWPLLGVHRLLATEKERLLEENTRRLEAGIAELHARMDRRNLKGMDDLSKALASLDLERSALVRIPTWPWEQGTLRGLIAALIVPILVWAIQLGAERLLT
jgi:hypothetical protein